MITTPTNCEICEIIPEIQPEFVLIETDHWLANLRYQDQSLLGTSFITARRHVPELDHLSAEEESDLVVVRNSLIRATRAAFNPITFNVSCLKNDAFRDDPDHTPPEAAHVHWHIKPRYRTEPEVFAGHAFLDPAPGQYLDRRPYRPKYRYDVAVAIADAIRSEIAADPAN